MKRTSCVTSLCVGLLVALGACGDGDTAPTGSNLNFAGDLSFQGPHGGHSIAAITRSVIVPCVSLNTRTAS